MAKCAFNPIGRWSPKRKERWKYPGESVFAHLDSAASMGLEFRESHVHVGRNGAFAELDLTGANLTGRRL